MQLSELIAAMEKIAPTANAESWDNVGLLVGDPAQAVTKVLLTIDYTADVAEEGTKAGCDAVIAYHPPIFQPLKRVIAGNPVFDALRRGIAIYSPHTALDVADGGTNDVLCDVLGLQDRSPLKLADTKSTQYKLVTFVPEEHVERVSNVIFEAGAGHIGNYTSCSFRSPGTGTFFGQEGSNPAVGEAGKLERAQEVRLETVVPLSRVSEVVIALRQSHPYEEPAFDLQQLAAPPTGVGIGRIGSFPSPTNRSAIIDRLKRELGINYLLVAGATTGSATRAAVCAGACGDLLNDALSQKADIYVTGEMRHHDALRAASTGMTVICTLHSNSERITLGRLKHRLQQELPELQYVLSAVDCDPFSIL